MASHFRFLEEKNPLPLTIPEEAYLVKESENHKWWIALITTGILFQVWISLAKVGDHLLTYLLKNKSNKKSLQHTELLSKKES